MSLPDALYTVAQVREFDRVAIERHGLAEVELMERAGAAALAVLRERWPLARRVTVVCGIGNNGGDGFVLARLACAQGLATRVVQVGDAQRLRGAARHAHEALRDAGCPVDAFTPASMGACDVIVDALLGTGRNRVAEGVWATAISAINGVGVPVLALDIPSGLDADTGHAPGATVKAQATVVFLALKQGLFTAQGTDYCGALHFNDLGVAATVFAGLTPAARRISFSDFPKLAARRPDSNKGTYGHVLVVGGDEGMGGAVRLAGEAAARVGAGLVSVATRAVNVTAINSARPELLCTGIDESSALEPLLKRASVVAIGPGLGRSEWAHRLLHCVLEQPVPLVVDADALNWLAQNPQRREGWILTPHPGEAARLLGCDTAAVQADRFAAVTELRHRYGGTVVLKGAGTLVAGASGIAVCTDGNAGMASGGMGDVLTGVIAGLVAQGVPAGTAARFGVCLHGAAGDVAARDGMRGLLACDVVNAVRLLVNAA